MSVAYKDYFIINSIIWSLSNGMVKGSRGVNRQSTFFVKTRVKRKVEEEAENQGATVVTAGHVNTCKNGFINKMEDEVKGFQVETCFNSGGCPNSAIDINAISDSLEKTLLNEDVKGFLKERIDKVLQREMH
jgi:anaerobic sulfite reductase subunit C